MELTTEVREECPFCKTITDIGVIKTPRIEIRLCSSCHKCWEILNGTIDRLIRLKGLPESDSDYTLCPICWRELQPDYDRWVLKCLDPICSYEKRLLGLDKSQRQIRQQYVELRTEVFNLVQAGEDIPGEKQVRLKSLREEYKGFRKHDPEPLK